MHQPDHAPVKPAGSPAAISKTPVFGWANFGKSGRAAAAPSVADLPHVGFTTSGRAAIFQALQQLDLPLGSTILLPTYHCPTMIAPGLLAGLRTVYFGIRSDGLPNLDEIPQAVGADAKVMIVSHYFGLPQSLHEVRAWCDARGIALIEDCAHCFFGQAGERQVGAWGDFCTASLSKFFPVPEAGLLGSAHHRIRPVNLAAQGLRAQIKGWVDVLETSTRYLGLPGLNSILAAIFNLKKVAKETSAPPDLRADAVDPTAAMLAACDMGRIDRRPLAVASLLYKLLPQDRIVRLRVRNFQIYAQMLSEIAGSRALISADANPAAPYVFPLWVDDAERVYHALRISGFPIFRWDRIWPDTPVLKADFGADWSAHVLQLLCHQDLSEDEIRATAVALIACIGESQNQASSGSEQRIDKPQTGGNAQRAATLPNEKSSLMPPHFQASNMSNIDQATGKFLPAGGLPMQNKDNRHPS